MAHGVIPVRHSSLPGLIKLPKRYEKAAIGDPRTARHRKVSVCAGSLHLGETLADRLDDLTMAVTWVKQELILLRQHDILLKRQFFNIHDSIQSLLPNTNTQNVASFLREPSPTSHIIPLNNSVANHNSDPGSITSNQSLPYPACKKETPFLNPIREYSECQMETFTVRPATSVTLLSSKQDDGSDYDSEGCQYHRPRTSSMKTSRDLAAVARRRGSKDLI
ncbi:hypothetical protein BsWGS_02906 [Bradybaena similaris]